ncbi:hypothetical protein NMG60_11002987 [Bertholletia excelsa]
MESSLCSSTPKVERRIVEKNRRNHMKTLYTKLFSLLPNHDSKDAVPLPDQIDAAVKYIKSLQMKLERSKERKESLIESSRKRPHSSSTARDQFVQGLRSPQMEIREMGSALEVVLITGEEDKFIFYEIIRVIHEEGAEVVSANFSVLGDSVFHVVQAKREEFVPNLVTATLTSRLKELVNGSTSDSESPQERWDFEIQPDVWEFEIPHGLTIGM